MVPYDVNRLLYGRLDLREVRDVRDLCGALHAGRPEIFKGLTEAFVVDIYPDDLRTACSALLSNELSEPTTRAGNDDDLVRQVFRHLVPIHARD